MGTRVAPEEAIEDGDPRAAADAGEHRRGADQEEQVSDAEDVRKGQCLRDREDVAEEGKPGVRNNAGVAEAVVLDRYSCGNERGPRGRHGAAVRGDRGEVAGAPNAAIQRFGSCRFAYTNAIASP